MSAVEKTADAYGSKFALKPREENVAQILPNSPEWMDVYLACSGAGVAVVPLDPKLHNDEVLYILKDSGAVAVTTDEAHLDMMQAIVPNLPAVRAVVLVDGDRSDYGPIGSVPVYGYEAMKEGVEPGWYAAHVAQPGDIASVIYTSGTTGRDRKSVV